MDMKQWTLPDIEACSICFFQVLRIFFFFLNNYIMGIHQSPKAHPQRTIQYAVIHTSFRHEKLLFHLPLHFLESFTYCVPLIASF